MGCLWFPEWRRGVLEADSQLVVVYEMGGVDTQQAEIAWLMKEGLDYEVLEVLGLEILATLPPALFHFRFHAAPSDCPKAPCGNVS